MSGGHFNHDQYKLIQIADQIQNAIDNNDTLDEYGQACGYSPETLTEFANAVNQLRTAHIYANRIDYLLSGDDGEDNFHRRLKNELDPQSVVDLTDEGYSTQVPLWTLKSARDLAIYLNRNMYPDNTEFVALDDMAGVVSQLDNMITGIVARAILVEQKEKTKN